MRLSKINLAWLLLLTTLSSLGCGEDAPNTPPVEEWCDLDRPREDCELRDDRIEGVEDMARLCESPCTAIGSLILQNGVDGEVLKGLKGFTRINFVSISSTHSSVKNLSFLSEVEEMQILMVGSNPGLENLEGLENIQFLKSCEECERRIEISGNPKLRSFKGLENVKNLEYLVIAENNGLEVIDGFDSFESGTITITLNDRLKRIAGFSGMVHNSTGINIIAHRFLTRLELWPNLKTLGGITLDRNFSLNMCDVDRIIAQLDEPPEMNISDTNGPPCAQ